MTKADYDKAEADSDDDESKPVELIEKFKSEKDEYANRLKAKIQQADQVDKAHEKERVKKMHKEKKMAKKDLRDV